VLRTCDSHRLVVFGLILALALSSSACGDDDGDASGTDTSQVAVAPDPADAFRDLRQALEAQGLVVSAAPKSSLHGAETGVSITGSKSGTALLFSTEDKAKHYADEVAASGDDKTTVVGAAVFQAPTQDDANFFADAYEGG
jgi:hypothetical protein